MIAFSSIWNNPVSWKQFAWNKRVSLAISHTIQVQWSILKYIWDKTKKPISDRTFCTTLVYIQLYDTYTYHVERPRP